MLKLLRYMRLTDWLGVLFVLGLVIIQVWLELLIPEYVQDITVKITSENSSFEMTDIWTAGGWMLGCALGSLFAAICSVFISTRIAAGFAARLRQNIFERVESFSLAEINRFSTPSLITRTTNDVTQVQMLVGLGTNLMLRAPVMAIWAIVKISSARWDFMIITAGAIVVMFAVVIFVIAVVLPKFRQIQGLTDNLNRLTRENLTGLRVVRAYNAESYQQERFGKANEEMMRVQLFTNRSVQVLMPSMILIMSGLTLGITLIGAVLMNRFGLVDGFRVLEDGTQVTERALLFSETFTFSQYATNAVMAFVLLVMIFIIMPRAVVSARRILEVLDTEPTIKDGAGVETKEEHAGTVEFQDVSFRYPDAEECVLENISFSVERGETIAFIGSTGSGKSTLINLIPRFYDATKGRVLVNGADVKEYTLSVLFNRLGFIAQKGVLFSGTVRDNIAYGESGNPVSDEEVWRALEIAQAKEFVEALEDGLDAHVAQDGTNFSGGQRQRLSIARAIAKRPEILIFDDSFSALDYKTDRALRLALKTELGNTTNVIVAQRVGTIRDADKIVVLDNGRMVGIGTHSELMKSCPVYQEIAYSQLSKEELEHGRA